MYYMAPIEFVMGTYAYYTHIVCSKLPPTPLPSNSLAYPALIRIIT